MIKPLTSLRIFFALMVFTSHWDFMGEKHVRFFSIYTNIFHEGFVGVGFFFVLSGFVLALNYKELICTKSISFKDFWIARIARIYPLHILTLLISIPIVFTEILSYRITWLIHLVTNTLLIQSFIPFSAEYFAFNSPSWSISDETFFYLLFPFLILLFLRFQNARKLFFLISLLVPVGMFFCPQQWQAAIFYINPLSRIFDFILGMMLYEIYQKNYFAALFKTRNKATKMEIAAVFIFVLFFAFHPLIPKVYRYSCYYWVPIACILFVFAKASGFISLLLSNKWLVLCGEFSFGFYLFHELVIQYFSKYRPAYIVNDFVFLGMISITTILLSYLSLRYFEQPCNRWIKRGFFLFQSERKLKIFFNKANR